MLSSWHHHNAVTAAAVGGKSSTNVGDLHGGLKLLFLLLLYNSAQLCQA